MDVACRNAHDREEESLNPVWSLAHVSSESGMRMLKILLDHGLDTISAEVLISHIFVDMEMCDGCDTQDEWWMEQWAQSLKMVMLIASYSHVLETSPYIRRVWHWMRMMFHGCRIFVSGIRSFTRLTLEKSFYLFRSKV